VSARESHGGEGRIRAARFPSRKSIEEFDFEHARSLKRDTIAHLGTLDFVTAKENVLFLGPPRKRQTYGKIIRTRKTKINYCTLTARIESEDRGIRVNGRESRFRTIPRPWYMIRTFPQFRGIGQIDPKMNRASVGSSPTGPTFLQVGAVTTRQKITKIRLPA
jgi:hypothetical protein